MIRALHSLSLAALLGAVCLTACSAAAQPRPRVAGLAEGLALSEVLARTELSLVGIVVPVEDGGPVRLELGAGNGVVALVDVRVLPDAGSASERLSSVEPALSSRGVVAAAGLGDRGLADEAGTVAAFARANVVVVVRTLESGSAPALDARALAARLVQACDAAPRLTPGRAPRASVIAPSISLQPGQTLVVPTPPTAVAMRVTVDGDGIARSVEGGWEISRGASEARIDVVVVDALLRVAR